MRDGWKEDVEADIRRLQAEGFNVVDGPVTMAGEVKDVPELQHVSERGERLEKGANTAGESGKSLGVRGGIEKKRVSTGKVANAFGVKNRQKLSFVESDSDSESS